jgi:hypothetical protein
MGLERYGIFGCRREPESVGVKKAPGRTSFIYPKNNREENALWLVSHSSTYRKPTRAV